MSAKHVKADATNSKTTIRGCLEMNILRYLSNKTYRDTLSIKNKKQKILDYEILNLKYQLIKEKELIVKQKAGNYPDYPERPSKKYNEILKAISYLERIYLDGEGFSHIKGKEPNDADTMKKIILNENASYDYFATQEIRQSIDSKYKNPLFDNDNYRINKIIKNEFFKILNEVSDSVRYSRKEGAQ